MDGIVWQPNKFTDNDFEICLDGEFAKRMFSVKLPADVRSSMNNLGTERARALGFNWNSPYMFHEGTGIIGQIHLGNNGLWLSTSHSNLERLGSSEKIPYIPYNTHNVNTARQGFALLSLFGLYIDYSNILVQMSLKQPFYTPNSNN